MFKSLNYTLLFLSIVVYVACSDSEVKGPLLKQEKNQVWSVKEVDGEFKKDQTTYLDTYEYDEEGNEIGHLIYNVNGNITGKELSVFDDSQEKPVGTRYYDMGNNLLSYYQLTYNTDGFKDSRKGFDASNDELLRIERFNYDSKGNMIKKEVRTADNQLISTFEFQYDGFGNKVSMVSKDGIGTTRISEQYKITKRDINKLWLENWGWQNDKPISFRSRELIYY